MRGNSMIEFFRRLVMGLAFAGALSGCPSGGGGGSHPTPPPATPPPVVVGTPAKGTPVNPEMLPRTEGNTLKGTPMFMAIPCCEQFTLNGQPVNTRWPMASKEWMDYTGAKGANFFHFRYGPFYGDAEHESEWVGVGGPYAGGPGSDWNPIFWQEVRDLHYHALKMKAGVENNVIDTWYCKHAQWGDQQMPWPAEDIAACGIRPSPEQERFIRKVVSEVGCFGNGIWLTDNEGSELNGTTREWYIWVHDIIRDEEQKSGCGFVHMIGTNNPNVADGPFDYVATHARTPVTSIAGKYTINNERNPQLSPSEEQAYFAQARKIGQAWAFWRAGMNDADFEKTLQMFSDVAKEGTQVSGCVAPPSDDPAWKAGPLIEARPSQTLGWLNESKARLGDPKALPGQTVWDRGLLALDLLAQDLRAHGHCASGPWADAVVIQAPDGYWEEMHAIAFTDGGYSGAPYKNVWEYPGSAAAGCPSKPPETAYIYCRNFSDWQDGRRWDCTPQKRVAPVGGSPVWPEDSNRAACELQSAGGSPSFSVEGALTLTPLSNPWQFKLAGSGTAKLHCYIPKEPGVDKCGYEVSQ